MKHFFIATFLLASWAGQCVANERPNIIVIFTDDHGWADLKSQGIERDLRTPNLDALAQGGLRATNGYVTAPQCVPSRGGLLSGRYQNRFGLESNKDSLAGFNQQVTIAERLKTAGYATGMSGKWHLGPPQQIVKHGFDDVYYKNSNQNAWTNYGLDGKTLPGASRADGLYHLDANSTAACAFIERHKTEPFFFYLAYRAPHVPLDAPKKYLDRFPGKMPERRRQCLAMLSAVDDGVGRVMDTLRKHKLENNTLIFVMGDNGAPLKIHKEDKPGGGPGWDGSLNAPMNGEKGMLSEGGIRVPWLAYWKGVIPAGQVYDHPVISLDVAATAVAAAGISQKPQELDGVNLLPYFTGETKSAPHDVLYWRWISQAAIREGQWKLLAGGQRRYLFNLSTDPSETTNLAAKHPDIAQRLETRLTQWSQELKPPGLVKNGMAQTWETYFDFYLDGKPAPPLRPSAARADNSGWVIRNGSAKIAKNALQIIPKAKDRSPFIAFSSFKIPGPATAKVTLQNTNGGSVGVSWRLSSQKDFPAGQTTRQKLPASAEPQTAEIPIPADGTIIHLRLLLPEGETQLFDLTVKANTGKAEKKWTFETPAK